jgi:predicted anti-sigma-YlaC factor YlaD
MRRFWAILLATLSCLLATGCSVRRFAIGQLGSALAQGGGAFAQEDDVQLAGQAAPFSLKLIESLLLQAPDNPDLLLAAASGYTQYAYGWVQQPADFLETEDPKRAASERLRARSLYLRAHAYARRAWVVRLRDFETRFSQDNSSALAQATREDVALLYWSATSLGAAIALGKQEPKLVARVPEVAAYIDRATALDPDWNAGSLHSFLVSFEQARPGMADGAETRARSALQEALRASAGLQAGPLVAFAESVSVQTQDRAEFTRLLEQALAIDLDRAPDLRLANRLHQERARWLLSRTDDLILE